MTGTRSKLDNLLGDQLNAVLSQLPTDRPAGDKAALALLGRALVVVDGDGAEAASDDPASAIFTLLKAKDNHPKNSRAILSAALAKGGRRGFTQIAKAIEDWQNSPEPDWAVERLVPHGGTCMIAAKPKVGKSTLARNLCVAVAMGSDFLGRKVTKGRALYAIAEGSPPTALSHFQEMLGEHPERDLPLFHEHGRVPPDETLGDWLKRVIELHEATLAVFDPLARYAGSKDSQYEAITADMNPFIEVAYQTGCAIVLPHHANKRKSDQHQSGDEVTGSTAYYGSVDTVIVLQTKDGLRTVETPAMRSGDELKKSELELDASGFLNLGPPTEIGKLDKARDAIHEELRIAGKLSLDELVALTGCNSKTLDRALKVEHASGAIVIAGKGVKGSPKAYSLPE